MSSLANALVLVKKAVAHQANGLSFTQLNKGTAIPQGSAHRIAKELVSLGLLEFDERQKTYRGGLALAVLGSQIVAQYDLRQAAQPALKALHAELGHVVTLGVRNANEGIYIDKIEAPNYGLRLHSEIGKAFPLHCTAMGKVLLAYSDTKTRREFLRRKLPSFTPNTITDPEALGKEFEKVLDQGYAIDNEEITRGLVCIAAPIFDIGGSIAGAISFTCETHTYSDIGAAEIIERVKNAAKDASV